MSSWTSTLGIASSALCEADLQRTPKPRWRPGAGIETDHTAFGRGVDAQTVKAATPKADYMIKLED